MGQFNESVLGGRSVLWSQTVCHILPGELIKIVKMRFEGKCSWYHDFSLLRRLLRNYWKVTKCSRNTELDIYLPKTKMHKQMFNACSLNIPQRAITFLKLLFFPHFSFSSHLCAVLMRDVREMFNMSFSLNFYMFHGGTNFGFMGGSASLDHYLPMVTSYGKYLSPTAVSTLGLPTIWAWSFLGWVSGNNLWDC